MNKVEQFMSKSDKFKGVSEEILKLEQKIEELKAKLNSAATFSIRFEGWSSNRELRVSQDKILLQVTPHKDGCETCKKRLGEIYSIIDPSICSLTQLGDSRWDMWVEIPITSDCDPLELISKALRGRRISFVY